MNVFMGQVLTQSELPANSPRPPETPQEGVVVVDNDMDGMTRKYLYKAMGGDISEVLISEAETPAQAVIGRGEPKKTSMGGAIPLSLGGIQRPSPSGVIGDVKRKLAAAPISSNVSTPTIQVPEARGPRIGEIISLPGASQNRPALQKPGPVQVDGAPMTEARPVPMTSLPASSSFLENSVSVVEKPELTLGHVPQKQFGPGTPLGVYPMGEIRLGQTAPAEPAPQAPDQAPAVEPGTCPGAVEMPDGRRIDPEDTIKLQDLCELMPFLLESYGQLQAQKAGNGQLAPGQSVPVKGQQAAANGSVPSTQSQFSPTGGGGGFVGGGGGAPGPAGQRGPVGPQGAPGPGSILEPPVIKTDGNFSASAGGFVPIPGAHISWVQTSQGSAELKAIVTLGDGSNQTCENAQLGWRVDGVDQPLTVRSIHTEAAGVGEFDIGQCLVYPTASLAAGPHEADLLIRGLLPFEFGGGTGQAASVNATPEIPLIISVSHN